MKTRLAEIIQSRGLERKQIASDLERSEEHTSELQSQR